MRLHRLLACASLVLACAPLARAQIALHTLALSSQHAPDTAADVVYDPKGYYAFLGSNLGAGGEIAFSAYLRNQQGVSQPGAFYFGTPDNFHILARDGDVAPGTGGLAFYHTGFISIGQGGNAAFDATLPSSVPGSIAEGLWLGRRGALTKVAQTGEHAPGTPDGVTWGPTDNNAPFGVPVQTAADRILFDCKLTGTGVTSANNSGYWAGTPGNLALVARLGDPAPGTDATFASLGGRTMNHLGNVALRGGLSGANVTAANDSAAFAGTPGNLALLVREGDPAPGANGALFGELTYFSILQNNAGQYVFRSLLTGPNSSSADAAIFSGKAGYLRKVIRVGDSAPGLSDGNLITELFVRDPVINHSGAIAFAAKVGDPANTAGQHNALYLAEDDQFALVAQVGDPAPGAAAGATLYNFNNVMLNASGDLLIASMLGGTGSGMGLFIWHKGQGLAPVAVPGQSIEVAPGDVRILSTLRVNGDSGMEDGRPSSFNDRGDFVAEAVFTDGSQAILYGSIPEPGCTALLAFTGLLLRRRR